MKNFGKGNGTKEGRNERTNTKQTTGWTQNEPHGYNEKRYKFPQGLIFRYGTFL